MWIHRALRERRTPTVTLTVVSRSVMFGQRGGQLGQLGGPRRDDQRAGRASNGGQSMLSAVSSRTSTTVAVAPSGTPA